MQFTPRALMALGLVAILAACASPSGKPSSSLHALPTTIQPKDNPSQTTTVSFVAHEDDDLLFMNPDIASDALAGYNVWVIYLTAGNEPIMDPSTGTTMLPMTDANDRIEGVRAAYAKALGIPNNWMYAEMNFGGHPLATNTLVGTNVHLVFTFISAANAGDVCGDLYRMLHNRSYVANPIDGRPAYTEASFVGMLSAVIQTTHANYIRTQDTYGFGEDTADHVDHVSGAILATFADRDSAAWANRYEYQDYGIEQQYLVPAHYPTLAAAENVPSNWRDLKLAMFNAYWPLDKDPAFVNNAGHQIYEFEDEGSYLMSMQYDKLFTAQAPWSVPTQFANNPGMTGGCDYRGAVSVL